MNSSVTLDILLHAGSAVLLVGAVCLLLLASTLAVELVAGLGGPVQRTGVVSEARGSYVVVVPAHNEVGTIENTLEKLFEEVTSQGRVLVVADNCTDDTAAVAEAKGATVVRRCEPERRGKGYAINFAVNYLAAAPPDVVIILDADCCPDEGALGMLFAECLHRKCPLQARYELVAPDANASPLARVGAFAWRIKNTLRPEGLARLGVPCLLTGTGMALPWSVLARSHLETGHLVEDMVLGLQLAGRGEGAQFLPEACVRSELPPSLEGQKSQRKRWETGHIQVIWQHVPRLLFRAIMRADWRLLALAFHTAVPPLALLMLLLFASTIASGLVAVLGGPSLAFAISALATGIALVVFTVYWHKVGRSLLSSRELLLLPGYVFSKLSLYGSALIGKKIEWVRSKRD